MIKFKFIKYYFMINSDIFLCDKLNMFINTFQIKVYDIISIGSWILLPYNNSQEKNEVIV